ncbi:hypothetical protein N7533_003543 [Penicillium manginii]|uniref:uncharacterized protein n=1 Tax=Penicillium manginii TaxID=203109 RepID=UPI0025469167|nr:uncharacterized protein N7533_003543 [Penicillium manginii]KAJ5761504.1 hypothetical protein N7533_003543 [Penicillium manginii]
MDNSMPNEFTPPNPPSPERSAGRSRQSPEHTKWEEYMEAGAHIHRWIEDSSAQGCFVTRISLNFTDLLQQRWSIRQLVTSFPTGCLHEAITLGIVPYTAPAIGEPNRHSIGIRMKFQTKGHDHPSHHFDGIIAKGAIFITHMERVLGASRPWISELIKAAYENEFSIDTLRHVFFNIVVNKDTSHLIKNLLYAERRGLSWPDVDRQIWEYATTEYQAILGTRIGKVVGYLVLGAFSRGTRRISRIVSWPGVMDTITLRFELEEC